ncbi:MAG: ABC transporter substrate-binding protein [Luteolibacter sp.]
MLLAGCSSNAAEPDASADPAESKKDFGECEVTENPTVHEFDSTITEGLLTAAAPLPAPGVFNGDTPESVKSGHGYCLLAEIANRGGLNGVKVIQASWESVITAKETNFDVTMLNAIITPERQEVVDFSTSYQTVNQGVLVREGETYTRDELKDLRIGYLIGGEAQKLIEQEIKPTQEPKVFQKTADMTTALMANQVDVIINDVVPIMRWVHQSGDALQVIAQFKDFSGDYGLMLPKDSANTAIVDQILEDMREDGTLDKINDYWISTNTGGKVLGDLPVW